MPETPETAAEIQDIRFQLEEIQATQRLWVWDRMDELLAKFKSFFAKHADLRDIYLAIDGRRTQGELVEAFKDAGKPMSEPTMTRRIEILRDAGLIERTGTESRGKVYRKNPNVEKILQLSKRI